MSEFSYQCGRLSYRQHSTGAERGHEDWWLTLTRGLDFRPQDCFIRLQVNEQRMTRDRRKREEQQ